MRRVVLSLLFASISMLAVAQTHNLSDSLSTITQGHVRVKIETPLGDIVVRLYDATPLHRDNFVRLVKEGYYDNTLFHRVIKGFMIQRTLPQAWSTGSSP